MRWNNCHRPTSFGSKQAKPLLGCAQTFRRNTSQDVWFSIVCSPVRSNQVSEMNMVISTWPKIISDMSWQLSSNGFHSCVLLDTLKILFQLQFRLNPVPFLHYLSECESNTQNLKATRPLGTRVQKNTGFQTAPSFISVYKVDIWWWLCAVLRWSFVEGGKKQGSKSRAGIRTANFWLALWLLTSHLIPTAFIFQREPGQIPGRDWQGAPWSAAEGNGILSFS